MRIFKKITVVILAATLCLTTGCTNLRTVELSDTHFIMDTICTIRIGGNDKAALSDALNSAFDRIYEVSNLTDYFSDTSDVSAVNNAKKGQPVKVSDDVFYILTQAVKIGNLSGGAFDITLAPLKDIWTFDGGTHAPPEDFEVQTALFKKGLDKLILDESCKSVTKKDDNVKIDLGGCAKGYAADCALDVIKQYDISYALIDLGGNILTYGDNPKSSEGTWQIGIQKPFADSSTYSQTVSVHNSAVVTSGTYQRYFTWEGKLYHHILDPETGKPVDNGISGVTIISASALTADCLSTACLVLGETEGKALADRFGAEIYVTE